MKHILSAFVLLTAAATVTAQQSGVQHHQAAAPSAKALKQLQAVERAAAKLSTPEAARAAGYEPVLGWIPMMGTHWVHGPRMLQGKSAVTIDTPSQLMFSPVNGKQTVVGIAYAYYAPTADKATPVLFDGAPAWHDHPDLSPPGTNMQMLHAWFVASPDGPFAGLNPFLPYWAAGVEPPDVDRMHDAAASARVRKGALALAEIAEPAGLFPVLAKRPTVKPVLDERRSAIRALVSDINAARPLPGSPNPDWSKWDALVDSLCAHFDAMREAYLASALDPNVRTRIAMAVDEMIHGGHRGGASGGGR